MRPRLLPIFVAALAGLVWWGAGDPAGAGIVRDGKASPANPAIEAGGVHPMTRAAPPVPYSLIGAIANEGYWRGSWQYGQWPLLQLTGSRRHALQERMMFRSFNALPPTPPIWIR
jgi:hypothetical protein